MPDAQKLKGIWVAPILPRRVCIADRCRVAWGCSSHDCSSGMTPLIEAPSSSRGCGLLTCTALHCRSILLYLHQVEGLKGKGAGGIFGLKGRLEALSGPLSTATRFAVSAASQLSRAPQSGLRGLSLRSAQECWLCDRRSHLSVCEKQNEQSCALLRAAFLPKRPSRIKRPKCTSKSAAVSYCSRGRGKKHKQSQAASAAIAFRPLAPVRHSRGARQWYGALVAFCLISDDFQTCVALGKPVCLFAALI